MLAILAALAGGLFLASRGIVRIGESGSTPVYLFDALYNLREANDPKNPTPGARNWARDETIGPKLVDAAVVPNLTLFDDWEWVLDESNAYRLATRHIYDPRTRQWQLLKTRSNY